MNTVDYVGSVASLNTCTLYRPMPLVSDAPDIPINQQNMQLAEKRRQQYQNTLNHYPVPEPDHGASINTLLFDVSVVELPVDVAGHTGEIMCLPSLVVQALVNNGVLHGEAINIDVIGESHPRAAETSIAALQGLQRPNDGCLYFDILMQECLHLGLNELHILMMKYQQLWGRTDQLEILALVVFYALSGDADSLLRFLNQDLSNDSLRFWWHSKPELHREIDDYIFFAFSYQWLTYC